MKKIILGVTAVDMKEMTGTTLSITLSNIANPENVQLVIIDNASKKPYKVKKGDKFVQIIRNEDNKGSFYPLLQLQKKFPDAKVIGIMHNDCAIYEKGWDEKLLKMFDKDQDLGAVGLFGWQKMNKYGLDELPVGNPLEKKKAIPYKRVKKLTPVATIDSMCMFFRGGVIPALRIDDRILLKHGYDKIFSLILRIHFRIKVAVSGFSFQHKGMGMFEDKEYLQRLKKWYDKRWGLKFPIESVEGMMMFEGRILLVDEFRRQLPITVKK